MPMLLKITAWVLSLKISFLPNIEIDMTLAKRHFQAKTAELAAKAAGSDTDLLKNASAYELMLAQLYEDKRKLKEIRSIETKGVAKVDEGIRSELIAIVNYGVIGLKILELNL